MSVVDNDGAFVDAFGEQLELGDIVVFVQKVSLTFQSRGAPRFIKAKIVDFTAKMIVVNWLDTQKLDGYSTVDFVEPPHTSRWNPSLCVKV